MSARATKALLLGCLALVLVLASGCRAAGTPTPSPNNPSSSGLVEEPKKHDDTEVTFKGEAIGEAMVRGDFAWIHVNDDPYYLKNVEEGAQLGGYNSGIPVYLPSGEAEKITHFGDYEHEGDIVEVVGVFHAACPQHGGDTDIHATRLRVVTTGHVVVDEVHTQKIVWAVGLSLLAALLFVLTRNESHNPKRGNVR